MDSLQDQEKKEIKCKTVKRDIDKEKEITKKLEIYYGENVELVFLRNYKRQFQHYNINDKLKLPLGTARPYGSSCNYCEWNNDFKNDPQHHYCFHIDSEGCREQFDEYRVSRSLSYKFYVPMLKEIGKLYPRLNGYNTPDDYSPYTDENNQDFEIASENVTRKYTHFGL